MYLQMYVSGAFFNFAVITLNVFDSLKPSEKNEVVINFLFFPEGYNLKIETVGFGFPKTHMI